MAATEGFHGEELLDHAEWLGRLALALVRDPADAKDLAQDTMVAALSKPPAESGPLRPWLAGVARNLARMRFRSRARREHREKSTDAATESIGADELIDRLEIQGLIAAKVRALPELYREVVLLRYYEGLSAAEIAQQTDCPPGTVRWRLKEGLDRMRAQLDKEHAGDRRSWALLIAPMSTTGDASSTVLGANTIQGVFLMSTMVKSVVVVGLIVCLYLASTKAGLWGEPPDKKDGSATVSRSPAGEERTEDSGNVARFSVPVEEKVRRTNDPTGHLRLEGQVIDEQENGVAGVRVAIDSVPPRTVLSDASGVFAFDGLVPRGLSIEAGNSTDHAGPLFLQLQEESEPVILRLRPAGRVVVSVVNPDGDPIVDAQVSLYSQLTWSQRSDSEGVAELQGIGAGAHTLVVEAPGFAVSTERLLTTGSAQMPIRTIVRLEKGAELSGHVVDSKGAPVSGVRVFAKPSSQPFPIHSALRDGVSTDKSGSWTLSSVAKGSYRIVASHDQFATVASAPMLLDGRDARSGLTIVMPDGATVVGVVHSREGHGVSGAQVRLVPDGILIGQSTRETYTDENGHFAFRAIAKGLHSLVATHRDGSSEITKLELGPGTEITRDLILINTGLVSGVVVDEEGSIIAEAHVLLEAERTGILHQQQSLRVIGQGLTIANGGGAFQFTALSDRKYRVRAARPADRANLSLGEGVLVNVGQSDVRIVLSSEAGITGKILFPDGSAPSSFTLTMGGGPGIPFANDEGSFAISAPRGRQHLTIAGPDFALKTVKVSVEAKTDVGTISVHRGRSVSGRVVDSDGVPVAGAQVVVGKLLTGDGKRLYIEDESINAKSTESDDEGWYSIAGFASHTLTIVAGDEGGSRSESIRLPSGPTSAIVNLVLRPTGSLSGTISKDGLPVAGTVVIANPLGASSSNFFVASGAEGDYSFDGLSPGRYLVFPMIGGGGMKPKDMFVHLVDVAIGEHSKLDMEIASGSASVEVSVETSSGQVVRAASVFVVGVRLENANLEALRDGTWLLGSESQKRGAAIYTRMALGGPTTISEILPGDTSVCVQPLPVNPNDPIAMMALRSQMDSLPLQCETFSLKEGENKKLLVKVPTEWAFEQ